MQLLTWTHICIVYAFVSVIVGNKFDVFATVIVICICDVISEQRTVASCPSSLHGCCQTDNSGSKGYVYCIMSRLDQLDAIACRVGFSC